jgi:hypothetical protein
MVSFGIENLLDEEPPCLNANPGAAPFPTQCSHVGSTFGNAGDTATYDPLGRRFFLSMNMEF